MADAGFDLLVLCAEEYQPPARAFPGVEVLHASFDDDSDLGPLPQERETAQQAAKRVALSLGEGQNVLVTCFVGRNRSGLVTGLAMVATGIDPIQPLQSIWDRREFSLTNEHFVALIASA